ncbi:hypothetical protein HK405_007256 [Cladochytrium tenue]|nr:hypothetical protein HK405_007256 [Cladochytrium tenue]
MGGSLIHTHRTFRRVLIWRRATAGPTHSSSSSSDAARQTQHRKSGKTKGESGPTDEEADTAKERRNVADFLTLLSQGILIGSTGLLIFSAVYPEAVSRQLEDYKARLTDRRHQRMLSFMQTHRPYITGSASPASDSAASPNPDAYASEIYHDECAADMRGILFGSLKQFGIVVGPPGSGKSHLLRRLAGEQPYYAFLSLGLVSGVRSLVDALSEELGYDFDDWAERMLSSYLFNGTSGSFQDQTDKLAFLLDEFEEACWSLKYDDAHAHTTAAPVLVLDDVDSLDFDDPGIRKAVRMLIHAANKWAREETCKVIFTMSDTTLAKKIQPLVGKDVLDASRLYEVGDLTPDAADRFLDAHLPHTDATTVTPAPLISSRAAAAAAKRRARSIADVRATVGTRIGPLAALCDETARAPRDRPLDRILADQRDAALSHVAVAMLAAEDLALAAPPPPPPLAPTSQTGGPPAPWPFPLPLLPPTPPLKPHAAAAAGRQRTAALHTALDALSARPGSGGPLSGRERARLVADLAHAHVVHAVDLLVDRGVLAADGRFASELMRHAYRAYRGLAPERAEYGLAAGGVAAAPAPKRGWLW